MSYKLEKDLPLRKNIREISIEEVEGCLTSLKEMDIHEAVHDVRKRLKKLRALARLVRDELGEEKYKTINIFYRDLGRELADLRDLTAHIETIGILRERYGDHLYVNFFNSAIKKIEEKRDEMESHLKSQNFFSEYLVQQLQHALKGYVNWPVDKNDIHIILPSIQRVYKRGRKAMQKSYENPGKENFHEWRKRVKYLWYQILLLQETWPQLFSTFEEEIHQLSDFLGDDHDLMVLMDRIEHNRFGLEDESQKELFIAIAREYSESLRANAKIKGELIYAEKPEDFTKRMAAYTRVNWN